MTNGAFLRVDLAALPDLLLGVRCGAAGPLRRPLGLAARADGRRRERDLPGAAVNDGLCRSNGVGQDATTLSCGQIRRLLVARFANHNREVLGAVDAVRRNWSDDRRTGVALPILVARGHIESVEITADVAAES